MVNKEINWVYLTPVDLKMWPAASDPPYKRAPGQVIQPYRSSPTLFESLECWGGLRHDIDISNYMIQINCNGLHL